MLCSSVKWVSQDGMPAVHGRGAGFGGICCGDREEFSVAEMGAVGAESPTSYAGGVSTGPWKQFTDYVALGVFYKRGR